MLAVSGRVSAGDPVAVRSDDPLPVPYRRAFDVRWLDDSRVALAVSDTGVVAFEKGQVAGGERLIPADRHDDTGVWLAEHLAASRDFIAVAASFFELKWRRRDQGPMVGAPRFEGVDDIDLHDDRLLAIGIRRVGPKAELAPDGAIVWLAAIGDGSTDLKPVRFSESGPGARRMIACGSYGLGVVRFLPDGAFVVVPGAEPGIFLHGPEGELQRTWDTRTLGLGAGCDFDAETEELYAGDIRARWDYLHRFELVDEVLPWDDGFALVVKKVDGKGSRWDLLVFDREGGPPRRSELPLRAASKVAHVKGDRRGDQLALLVVEEIGPEGQEAVPRLVFADAVRSPAQVTETAAASVSQPAN